MEKTAALQGINLAQEGELRQYDRSPDSSEPFDTSSFGTIAISPRGNSLLESDTSVLPGIVWIYWFGY